MSPYLNTYSNGLDPLVFFLFFLFLSQMAFVSSTNHPPSLVAAVPSNHKHNLMKINVAAQLPFKLTTLNHFPWKTQFTALFFGLGLLRYLDGTFLCPSLTIVQHGQTVPNLDHLLWRWQDQPILHATRKWNEAVIPLENHYQNHFVFFIYIKIWIDYL